MPRRGLLARPRDSSPVTSNAPAESREARFDALVRAHYGRLCSFVVRLVGTRATAEDIVQDVFARIWERHEQFDDHDPLPYLYRAARNGALMHLRHERVRERWLMETGGDARESRPVDSAVDADELSVAIANAVDALPERCRLVFHHAP